jgi:hypothetical protein
MTTPTNLITSITRSEALHAFADEDKGVIVQTWTCQNVWVDIDIAYFLAAPEQAYRVKPKVVTINGVDYPAPVKGGGFYLTIFRGERRYEESDSNTVYFSTNAEATRIFEDLKVLIKG